MSIRNNATMRYVAPMGGTDAFRFAAGELRMTPIGVLQEAHVAPIMVANNVAMVNVAPIRTTQGFVWLLHRRFPVP